MLQSVSSTSSLDTFHTMQLIHSLTNWDFLGLFLDIYCSVCDNVGKKKEEYLPFYDMIFQKKPDAQ